jgi:hypothetical protein
MLPGEWNELSTEQLVFLIHLVDSRQTPEEIQLKLLLFSLRAHVRKDSVSEGAYRFTIEIETDGKAYDLSAEELSVVADIFSFLFVRHDGRVSIDPSLTKNPFPTASCGRRTVYGTAEGLSDITYEQFVMLLVYYRQMQTSPEAIDDFLSVIYKSRSGKSHPEWMSELPGAVKTAAVWYFLGSLRFMAEKFPLTFSGEGKADGSVFESQMRVIDALASNDVTKKEIVKNALLYDALYTMEIAAENAAKRKK